MRRRNASSWRRRSATLVFEIADPLRPIASHLEAGHGRPFGPASIGGSRSHRRDSPPPPGAGADLASDPRWGMGISPCLDYGEETAHLQHDVMVVEGLVAVVEARAHTVEVGLVDHPSCGVVRGSRPSSTYMEANSANFTLAVLGSCDQHAFDICWVSGLRAHARNGHRSRIAVVRMLPGLGDLLCAVPALQGLRRPTRGTDHADWSPLQPLVRPSLLLARRRLARL